MKYPYKIDIYKHGLTKAVAKIEIEALKGVMHLSNNKAAKMLKLPNPTYRYKLKIYGLR
jgi:DNA-binding protein Fis